MRLNIPQAVVYPPTVDHWHPTLRKLPDDPQNGDERDPSRWLILPERVLDLSGLVHAWPKGNLPPVVPPTCSAPLGIPV